jgi:cytochrome c oxidase subunit II
MVLAVPAVGCGDDDDEPSAPAAEEPTQEPEEPEEPEVTGVALGEQLFADENCSTCHALSGAGAGHGSGPPLGDLFGSKVVLDDGSTVKADDAYLKRSIADPDAEIVRGFSEGDMSGTIQPGSIKGEDLDALVKYLKSL